MRAFSEIAHHTGGMLLLLNGLLLLFGQLYTCLRSVRMRLLGYGIVFPLIHFFLGFSIYTLVLDSAYTASYWGYHRTFAEAVLFAGRVPWIVYLMLELISGALLFVSMGLFRHHIKSHVMPISIKSALDYLPTGIAFGDNVGIVLSNQCINDVAHNLIGEPLVDVKRFRASLEEHSEDQGGRRLARTEDGSVWLFDRAEVSLDGTDYEQITASDVTELVHTTDELAEKNKRLRAVTVRMNAFRVRENDLFISREILTARTTVHDHMGNILLLGRYYLDHPESTDEASLLRTMEAANHFLVGEVESPDDIRDPYDYSMKMARSIGVNVTVNGPIPTEPMPRGIMGQLLGECATNAYKHAEATEVLLNIERTEAGYCYTATNNGQPPAGPVSETGGLASLRRITESVGGSMTITCSPFFVLKLVLPVKPSENSSEKE